MQAFVVRHYPVFLLLGVLVAQFLLLSLQITRNHNVRLIKVWAVAVFSPFQRSVTGLTEATALAWRTCRGLWRAQQENRALSVQLVAARSEIRQLSEQATETQRLRELLEFKNHVIPPSVAVEVIAASPAMAPNAVVIDKGTDSGLTTDLAVVTPEGVVGKTLNVFRHAAQVLLITDPSSGVGSFLERSRTQGVVKGAGNNLCNLEYVMNEEQVSPGDTILTSGLDQIYPKGLPVGVVIKVGDGNIYKSITVKPAAPLGRLETVLVVTKPSPPDQEARSIPAPDTRR